MVIGSVVYINTYLAKDVSSYSAQVVTNINVTYFYLLIITLLVLITYKLRIGIKITEHITPHKDARGQLEGDVLRIAQYRITQFVLGDHLIYN